MLRPFSPSAFWLVQTGIQRRRSASDLPQAVGTCQSREVAVPTAGLAVFPLPLFLSIFSKWPTGFVTFETCFLIHCLKLWWNLRLWNIDISFALLCCICMYCLADLYMHNPAVFILPSGWKWSFLGGGPNRTQLSLTVLRALPPVFFLISLATNFTGKNYFVLKTTHFRHLTQPPWIFNSS